MIYSEEMLNLLRSQTTHLDKEKYKVMLLWDPVSSRDVGWLTMEKEVKVDLSTLQSRDVNLSLFGNANPVGVVGNSFQTSEEVTMEESSASCIDSAILSNNSQEVINITDDISIDNSKNSTEDININAKDIKTEQIIVETPLFNSTSELTLDKCDVCGIPVLKINLENHKKSKHSLANERKRPTVKEYQCPCGKKYRTAKGLKFHQKRFCGKDIKVFGGLDRVNQLRSERQIKSPGSDSSHVDVKPPVESYCGLSSLVLNKGYVSVKKMDKIEFVIMYQGRPYDCLRSGGRTISKSLIKFCNQIVGKELKFEYKGKVINGTEGVELFRGGVIFAFNA